MTHPVPEAAFDKHVALLGMTGAGKTSVIKTAIVEPDLEADRRVLIITPKDDWWGLRLSKTGKSAGFDIPIFGGRHEDYPLQVKDAALLAETYGTMKGSAIFCTSRLSVQDRAKWFAAFAEKLLSANRGWVRVVIDEAHVFMPKQGAKGGGAVPLALHAGNELVSQGRSGGLRVVLASQRSAKLHNDALTQCSCLIAMLLMAPHDRDAVKDWIEDQADPQTGKEIIASLATLNPGQAWVWAPGAKFLERVQFARPSTFDSSAAPDDDSAAEHKLKPINLDALQGMLATVEAAAKAKDPKQIPALQAEIGRLTKALADAQKATAAAPDKAAIAAAEERGFERGKKQVAAAADRRIREARVATLSELGNRIRPLMDHLAAELQAVKADKAKIADVVTFFPVTRDGNSGSPANFSPRSPSPVRAAGATARVVSSPAASGDGTISPVQQRILDAIAEMEALCRRAPPRTLVALMAGYAHTRSKGFSNALSGLSAAGHVRYLDGGTVELTESGGALAAPATAPLTTADVQTRAIAMLGGVAGRVLENLIKTYPDDIGRDELAAQSGYGHTRSKGFSNTLSKLSSLGFVTYPSSGKARASDVLFP